jgi:hypothetical protein
MTLRYLQPSVVDFFYFTPVALVMGLKQWGLGLNFTRSENSGV